MYLYRSNRVETLAACLAGLCREPLASPLSRECIVVQSRGMATWLAMRLADSFGVWANPDFPHPRQMIERLLIATLGERAARAADWNRDRLALAVLEELPSLLPRQEFAPIARYFADGHDDLKWLQLAEHIALVFDQYAVFRPEMVLEWEAGGGADTDPDLGWQPLLWRAVAGRLVSPARLYQEAYHQLQAGRFSSRAALPDRLFLFGITTLPPLYLTLLGELARHLPVHLLLFSPAEEYWGETASTAAVGRLLRRSDGKAAADALHLEAGHPLLASLGTLGRDFQVLLEERLTAAMADHALFVAHDAPRALLHLLQDDILMLRRRHALAAEAGNRPLLLEKTDDSLVIHCCHSPLREVEVLQDQLLAMLGRDDLAPRDIAVMVPDIDAYAPFIEAVFGRDPADPRFIPFRIADRSPGREAPLAEAFFALLELLAGRLAAPQFLDFLAFVPVRERFGIAAEDLPVLERWVIESGIRWGIDENDRTRHGQPRERQNTWGFGFDRLLLGYALPGGGRFCWQGVLPYDELEGQDADLLGRFLTYGEAVFTMAARSSEILTIAAWQEEATALLAAIFRNGPEEGWQHRLILDAAAALARDAAQVGNRTAISLPAYARLLKARLEADHRDHGFLQGGVTFCAMLPMRTIPFTVICLLGLNDGAFPRLHHAVSFDLVARNPKRGDRSRRNDDRYLFLEALLAARRRLYLSYVGRSSRDNAVLPPSVVIDELLDCLADACLLADGEPGEAMTDRRQRLVARLVVQHPLQPFSPRYFDHSDPRLVSFAAEYHQAAQAVTTPAPALPAFAGMLPPPATAAEVIPLAGLRHFFRNPARFFCRQRLDLLLHDDAPTVPDREPLTLHALERFAVGNLLLHLPPELPRSEVAGLLQAKGILPPGGAGPAILHDIWRQIEPLKAEMARQREGEPPARLAVDLRLAADRQLAGELDECYGWGLLRTRPGKLNPPFLLACWLDHLAICAMRADSAPHTVLIARSKREEVAMARFRPVAGALPMLDGLAALRVEGEGRPLPFFPVAAHAYATAIAEGRGEDAAWRAGWKTFNQKPYGGGPSPEGEDPYVQKLFGHAPLADRDVAAEFAVLAVRVFGPLLDHLEEPA
ncbi:MAG: exodeoxyribonuclease V subunit gamma [Thermodesulfobacteriota bacterium]